MAAHRSRVIVSLAVAAAAFGVAVSVLQVSAQGSVGIPKKGDGYEITQPSTSQEAPEGFEGRTDTSTLTAVGNTPATMGKRVVAKFVFSNQIRTCPTGDGAAEGDGQFSITADGTENGAPAFHIAMRAKAKYKGKVNDDAYLDGPVKAEIDYTYVQSGPQAAPANVTQHITVPFVVAPGASIAPDVGRASGGDPSNGQIGDAFTVGTALAYWAGIYYSVAQTKWRTGQCVQLSYTPPEKTVQPALGTQVMVKALVKTKRGESVPAKFTDVRPREGSVSPLGGKTTDASPALTFTYTAPSEKPKSGSLGGFHTTATSRAGITEKDWNTNLGSNWSGQISCMRMNSTGPYSDEQVSASSYFVTKIDIEVNDGVAFATGYSETNGSDVVKRPVARQGYEFDRSSSSVGIAESRRTGAVRVSVNAATGTYTINADYAPFDVGKIHSETCSRNNGCSEQDDKYYIQSCFSGLGGKTDNPNQLHGEYSESKTTPIGNHTSTQAWSYSWDLSRQGKAK